MIYQKNILDRNCYLLDSQIKSTSPHTDVQNVVRPRPNLNIRIGATELNVIFYKTINHFIDFFQVINKLAFKLNICMIVSKTGKIHARKLVDSRCTHICYTMNLRHSYSPPARNVKTYKVPVFFYDRKQVYLINSHKACASTILVNSLQIEAKYCSLFPVL